MLFYRFSDLVPLFTKMGLIVSFNLLFGIGSVLSAEDWTVVWNVTKIPQDLGPALRRLRVHGPTLRYLNRTSLVNYPNLQKLSLESCGLQYIEEGSFDNTPELTDLYLVSVPLIQLPYTLGAAQLSLKWVKFWSMTGTHLYDLLQDGYLLNFTNLAYLGIGGNVLRDLNTSILPRQLTYLNVMRTELTTFPKLADVVPLLEHARFRDNRISTISLENLAGLDRMISFHIEYNQLERLPDIGFMLQLSELKVPYNNLASLPDLYHLPLRILLLTGNPLSCNKSLCWVRMWPWTKELPVLGEPSCEEPTALRGVKLMDVHPTLMHCYEGKIELNESKLKTSNQSLTTRQSSEAYDFVLDDMILSILWSN